MKHPGVLAAAVVGTTIVAATVSTATPAVAKASTVTVNCAKHSLQAAINHAANGSTLLVSGHCVGNFTIAAKNLTVRGNPTATIDADHHGRVLDISEDHVTLRSLTITGGHLSNGAGIFAKGNVVLRMIDDTVEGNQATEGEAGGIEGFVATTIDLVHSTITHNTSTDPARPKLSGDSGEEADGGAIFTDTSSPLIMTDSVVSDNTASAGSLGTAIESGGGVYASGPVTITGSTFSGNSATAISGFDNDAQGGALSWVPEGTSALAIAGTTFKNNTVALTEIKETDGAGGAIYLAPFKGTHRATVTGSDFSNNSVTSAGIATDTAVGGAIDVAGAAGSVALSMSSTSVTHSLAYARNGLPVASGGAIALNEASATISSSTLTANEARAVSTHFGNSVTENAVARGGAIDAEALTGPLRISTTTIASNELRGQSPDADVELSGGGVVATGPFPLIMARSTVSGNSAKVTAAAQPSGAAGGGLDLGSAATDRVTNSTIANNSVDVAAGPSASPDGGGVAAYDTALDLDYTTIVGNSAGPGGTGNADGGGLFTTPGNDTSMLASILSNNTSDGINCNGTVNTEGYNLFGSSDCNITPLSTDVEVGHLHVAALAANGGPTETIALGKHSTALNRVPKATCLAVVSHDQRGVKRPQGSRCDIGAYERKP